MTSNAVLKGIKSAWIDLLKPEDFGGYEEYIHAKKLSETIWDRYNSDLVDMRFQLSDLISRGDTASDQYKQLADIFKPKDDIILPDFCFFHA